MYVGSWSGYLGRYIDCKSIYVMSNMKGIVSAAGSVVCTCAVFESTMRSNNPHMVAVFVDLSVAARGCCGY
jgi:hypothetical protein